METLLSAVQRDSSAGPTWAATCRRFAGSAFVVVGLLARHQLEWPRAHVGQCLPFEDGTTSQVFRETVLEAPTLEPALPVVQFRLRLLGRAPLPHRLFRAESIGNTPLFAGFAGFRSKLWLCDDETGTYRGVYAWDGADRATAYAETLSMLLRLVSEPRSVTSALSPDPADTWWRLRNGTPDDKRTESQ